MSTNPQSQGSSLQPGYSAVQVAELRSRCERLEQAIQRLTEARNQDAEELAALRAELDAYRRHLYAWAHQQTRPEDWHSFAEAEYTISAADVLAELERQERP